MNMAFLLAVAQLLLAVFGSWGYMLLHCRPNEKRAISNFSRIGFYRREWIRDSIAMLNYMEILLFHLTITRNSNKICNTWKTDDFYKNDLEIPNSNWIRKITQWYSIGSYMRRSPVTLVSTLHKAFDIIQLQTILTDYYTTRIQYTTHIQLHYISKSIFLILQNSWWFQNLRIWGRS